MNVLKKVSAVRIEFFEAILLVIVLIHDLGAIDIMLNWILAIACQAYCYHGPQTHDLTLWSSSKLSVVVFYLTKNRPKISVLKYKLSINL